LDAAGQGVTVNVGTILQTNGCNLHCSHVLHVVAPIWGNDSTSSRQVGPVFKFSRTWGNIWIVLSVFSRLDAVYFSSVVISHLRQVPSLWPLLSAVADILLG
jgi:hypothetical protein